VNMSKRTLAGIFTAAFAVMAFAVNDMRAAQSTSERDRKTTARTAEQASITVVGCLEKESDYRSAHKLGKGAIGGVGLGDEFVLVDASPAAGASGTAASAGASNANAASATTPSAGCTERGGGQAYRLTGQAEEKLKPYVGRMMEITGSWDHARDARTAAGQTNATLPPEIKIATFREAPGSSANAAPASVPSSVEARNEPAPAPPPAPQASLPNTASHEPLIALIGFASLAVALGLHFVRRRAFR
jgi:LPXTG-motif cell wall-anchored protein